MQTPKGSRSFSHRPLEILFLSPKRWLALQPFSPSAARNTDLSRFGITGDLCKLRAVSAYRSGYEKGNCPGSGKKRLAVREDILGPWPSRLQGRSFPTKEYSHTIHGSRIKRSCKKILTAFRIIKAGSKHSTLTSGRIRFVDWPRLCPFKNSQTGGFVVRRFKADRARRIYISLTVLQFSINDSDEPQVRLAFVLSH